MANDELLIKTRNLVRYIIKELGDEINIKSRNDDKFFFDLMKRCMEVGIIEEDRGIFRLTNKEQIPNMQEGARHRGRRY